MYQIAFLIPYFGELPPFFEIWKKTAQRNEDVDFIFFSDNKRLRSEKNITVHSMTFSEYKELVQSKFDFPISLETPYKTCDYKFAYGYIFQDYIRKYDFWGYCDVDLVLGRIRDFITDEILESFDKVYELGHMTLYRNEERMNRLFMSQGPLPELNYQEVYTANDIFAFDEYYGGIVKSRRNKVKTYLGDHDFWDGKVEKSYFESAVDGDASLRIIFQYRDGRLYQMTARVEELKKGVDAPLEERPVIYAHFQKRVMDVPRTDNKKDCFYVVPNRFVFGEITAADWGIRDRKAYTERKRFQQKKKKICTHWKRYRQQKKEGSIHSVKEYIESKRERNRRFAEMGIYMDQFLEENEKERED